MNLTTITKALRTCLTAAVVPIALTACGSDDDRKIDNLDSEANQSVQVSSITIPPVTEQRLGSFSQFDSFEVTGLTDEKEVMLSVSAPFVLKVVRDGETLTRRTTSVPGVTDLDVFYADENFDKQTVFKTLIPEGFSRYSTQVKNGDTVTIGSIAPLEPETTLSGLVSVGESDFPVQITSGSADTTPADWVFNNAETAINAAPGENLDVSFFIKDIDYRTIISIVADNTPKQDDAPEAALGSARFTIGYTGIPGFEDRELESTILSDASSFDSIEESIVFLKSHYSAIAATNVENAIRKAAQDEADITGNPVDEASIQAELDIQVPLAIAEAEAEIDMLVSESYSKFLQGQFIRLTATAPLEYNQQAEVVVRVGDVEKTLLITTDEDTSPDTVSFSEPDAPLKTEGSYTTNAFTVMGINTATPISVENGEYQIDDGPFTSSPGVVYEGQSVRVRVTASAAFSDTVVAVLTVGDSQTDVAVTTQAPDITPEPFDFGVANASPNQIKASAPLIIEGYNDTIDISISAGEYKIDDGDWTSQSGVLQPGQSVMVRLAAGANDGAETSLVLTAGGVDGNFSVVATAALEGVTLFPPKHSFTEAETVFLRGELIPALGRTVSNLSVNGQPATIDATTNYWSIEYSGLEDGMNTLRIEAQDSAGQVWNDEVAVTKDTGGYGTGELLEKIHDVTIDPIREKFYVLSSDQTWKGPLNKIIEVDLHTGDRSLFVDAVAVNSRLSGSGGVKSSGVQYVPATEQVIIPNHVDDGLYTVPVEGDVAARTSASSVLSGYKNGMNAGSGDNTNDPMEMAVDQERNLLLVANVNGDGSGIVTVDINTGERIQRFSDQAISVAADVDGITGTTGDRYFYSPKNNANVVYQLDLDNGYTRTDFVSGLGDVVSLDVNKKSNVLVVGDHGNKQVITVDLDTNAQMLLSDSATGDNSFSSITAVATDDSLGYLVLTDNNTGALLAIDLQSGNRVYLSRNE